MPAATRIFRCAAALWLFVSSYTFQLPPLGLELSPRLLALWGLERLVPVVALTALLRWTMLDLPAAASPLALAIRWGALLGIASRLGPVLVVGFEGDPLEAAHRLGQALVLATLVDGPIAPAPERSGASGGGAG